MNNDPTSKNPNSYDSLIGLPLPGSADTATIPTEIQWMPPGTHTINATRAGKPTKLDVTVDKAGADSVAASFAAAIAAVSRGAEDKPYFDFNHDDKEASAWPTGFRWAGDDPQTGGIRAQVDWSASGKRAVLGRDYRRFSPTFLVDGQGRVSGAPINMGGLVNRAAFRRIQPVMAKSAEFEALLTDEKDFMSKAEIIAKSRNLPIVDAFTVLAREQPWSYDDYISELSGRPPRAKRPISARRVAECDEFMIRARALADAADVGLYQAAYRLAHEQPGLYDRYRAKLGLGDGKEVTAPVFVASSVETSPFFVRAKAIAAEKRIGVADAFEIAARQNPSLYDEYREDMF